MANAATSEADAYILGTGDDEFERLRFQDRVWIEQAYSLWTRAGIKAGDTVCDLGCGPGFTSLELAQLVGSEGRVVAHDRSARFVDFLKGEAAGRGLAQLTTSVGEAGTLSAPRRQSSATVGIASSSSSSSRSWP